MEPNKPIKSCAVGGDCCPSGSAANANSITARQLGLGLLGLLAWYIIYKQLLPFSHFFPMVCLALKRAAIWVRLSSSLSMILPR